jgi:hypothetical protein
VTYRASGTSISLSKNFDGYAPRLQGPPPHDPAQPHATDRRDRDPLAFAGGLVAAWASDERQLLTFVVFTLTTLPLFVGAVWGFVPDADDPTVPAFPDETIEQTWRQPAASGAFVDLLTAMAFALAAKYVLGAPRRSAAGLRRARLRRRRRALPRPSRREA